MVRIVYLLLLILTACGPRYVDYFTHHDDGTEKPRVLFVPVIVACSAPQHASEQLTCSIRDKTMDSGELYLFSEEVVDKFLEKSGKIDFSRKNFKFNQENCPVEFIAIVEIVSHTQGLIKVRLKVVDVRDSCSQVILLECIEQPTNRVGSHASCYKEAYQYLSSKITERLECVIWSNK